VQGQQRKRPGFRVVGFVWLAAALLASGCSRGRGDVTGTITFNNEPIPWGRVHFTSEGDNNEVLHSRIVNGRYSIANCPAGPVKISVESFRAPSAKTGPDVEMAKGFKAMMKDKEEELPLEVAGKYVEIPRRYTDAEQSGLTYDVSRGAQTHDIPLGP
jgi:hypothetical protein